MTSSLPLVAIVDDDESVRESLPDLLRELGYLPWAFPSAEEFLAFDGIEEVRCLILDVSMPGMSGPELHRELRSRGHAIPVIFITALAGRGLRSKVPQQEVVKCLTKPFSEQDIKEALSMALR